MSQRLFVGSLSFDTMDADLKQFFERAGACESASVIRDRATGRSRGFGFVVMASEDDARRAISELDGKELQGRAISVSEARERGQGQGRPPRMSSAPSRIDFRSADAPPPFTKSKGSRRGLRGRKRSL
jgi:RNA recognition motif-containing protein